MCQLCSGSNEQMEPTDNKLLEGNLEEHVGSSTLQDSSSSNEAPLTSPGVSLTSSDSNVSVCCAVDSNLHVGSNAEEGGSVSGQEDPKYKLPNGHHRKSSSSMSAAELSINLDENDKEGKNGVVLGNRDIGTSSDNLVEKNDDGTRCNESSDERNEPSPTYFDKDVIWDPPEAENEDDYSMGALDDDDDECADGDGTAWTTPSSLNDFEEGVSTSHRFKEEKQRAIQEVMNGKFKDLVSQLLRKVGVEIYDSKDGNWVDIVTLLAWQAASFLKLDASGGKSMDPAGYVKIKCVASGFPSESRLIKGLVFKKHAAHKHMVTKYKTPRLLLIEDMLDLPSGLSGFSSYDSMTDLKKSDQLSGSSRTSSMNLTIDKDEDNMADLIEKLKVCNPDVILVEKSASRNVIEKVLKLGVTLVLDMKRNRLKRVERCTGSPILSSDFKWNEPLTLKHCSSVYFEKFVEEHAIVGEGEKKPTKTLMFLEGCPTRLGCTILLKGSHSDELKKIKCVVQCAVVMAYNFILETSFLVDQKAMLSTIAFGGDTDSSLTDEKSLSVVAETSSEASGQEPSISVPISNGDDEVSSHVQGFSSEATSSRILDIPISNGETSESIHFKETSESTSSGFHGEVPHNSQLVVDALKDVSIVSPVTYENMSTYIHSNGAESEAHTVASIPISPTEDARGNPNEDKPLDNQFATATEDAREAFEDGEDYIRAKDEVNSVLDSESILVLMSTRNALRGTICRQSHFSHIKFYRIFDDPLGNFLQDQLFNQNPPCKACNGPPESHFYYYAHHNKQLIIRVKRLEDHRCLDGKPEGKLWMWSRCGKCEADSDKATKRVLLSDAARRLSFGKFLELNFSRHSTFNRLSSCGHSFQKDFNYFFGSGSMVAMLRYSHIALYTVSVPAQNLEFNCSIKREWLQREIESVYTKGLLLFTEVDKYLKKKESRFSSFTKSFADIVDMLKLERSEFEENIKNASTKTESSCNSVHALLSLNRLRGEILLEACIWEKRLESLLSFTSNYRAGQTETNLKEDIGDKEVHMEKEHNEGTVSIADNVVEEQTGFSDSQSGEVERLQNASVNGHHDVIIESKEMVQNCIEAELQIKELPYEGIPIIEENIPRPTLGDLVPEVSLLQDTGSINSDNHQTENNSIADSQFGDRIIPITDQDDNSSFDDKGTSEALASPPTVNSEVTGEWWKPFVEIREIYKGFPPNFGDLLKCQLLLSPDFSLTVPDVILEEGSRLHIPVGGDNHIVSDYNGEISSPIACSLAFIKDLTTPDDNATLRRASSEPSGWSASVSHDPDILHPAPSMPSMEPYFSSSDSLNLFNCSVSVPLKRHPEVDLGIKADKDLPKGKYSVVVMYAREFRGLRNWCCPSELDYIASLTRCKLWDAKGGKSKSFFAKTIDDRLIIKEIKKTEFDSFVKFAPKYFDHMKESFQSGNQTCLAKILGIYQVVIRHPKSGKETKHDLMVQENLSYGRNITRQYDLKGALHARFTATANDVLLDQNFVNDMNASPMYVGQKAKRLLQRAVYNDTTFLNSINVMDYSLLVGVDKQGRDLVCGIIDYLREYTWDKQFETWVKAHLITPKNMKPTVISPQDYKVRFRRFMDSHFLTVPDHWCSQRSSNPCKLCGIKGDDSPPVNSEK